MAYPTSVDPRKVKRQIRTARVVEMALELFICPSVLLGCHKGRAGQERRIITCTCRKFRRCPPDESTHVRRRNLSKMRFDLTALPSRMTSSRSSSLGVNDTERVSKTWRVGRTEQASKAGNSQQQLLTRWSLSSGPRLSDSGRAQTSPCQPPASAPRARHKHSSLPGSDLALAVAP